MQTTSSSTSSSYHWKYDVFLSFRGEDTRKSFIDHLYTAFNHKGLRVFKDDKELESGKLISPELLHAIEESRSAVVVFSKNYASSRWCLDELVHIVHCKNIKIFPVFYNVDPSVVRKQTGEFEEAFIKHEETFREDIGKVRTWRNALTNVANHSGFHFNYGYESQFIQHILKKISSKLKFSKYSSDEGLVGVDSRLEKLRKLISPESHDVRMIGICGMGGIGKTTIARVAYDLISCEFESSSFLANVAEISRKKGLVSLQKMLLSQILHMKKHDINVYNDFDGISMIRSWLGRKKVLIVIDDVNNPEQLEKLACMHDWFGMGSRIIITSRTESLLTSHGVDGVYKVWKLNDDDALELFSLKAFKKPQPSESFRELSKCVVQYASGLPLALEVLGRFLCGREVHIWKDALQRLRRDCQKEILDALQISYDSLEESEKKIFLDIACFFNGWGRSYVTRILESCGFFPNIGIDILIDKSLIIHKGYKLWMHDLLQQMGQQIVKRECLEEPGKRSRLWMEEDIHHVSTENTGTEKVEGMMLNSSIKKIHCHPKAFSKMINLRLLKLDNVQLLEGLDYLSNNLFLFDWKRYPLKSLPPNLQLDKMIELNLNQSCIEQLPQGIKTFNHLESISFVNCGCLIKTPDLELAPNLNKVNIRDCTMLREVHPSLLLHKKITSLDMIGCTSLTTLPNQIHMESLRGVLDLSYCYKLEKFPEIVGSMDYLRGINLDKTAIEVLPTSIELLSKLEDISLEDCKNLLSLPDTINGLESLRQIQLSGCSKLDNLPKTLWQVENLRTLKVRRTAIIRPMASLFLIKNLDDLDFSGCRGWRPKSGWSVHFKTFRLPTLSNFCRSLKRLILSDCNMEEGAIPNDFFDSFSSLWTLDLSKNEFVSLPGSINHLSKLRSLDLNGCKRLRSLPELPSNIKSININGCIALETTSNALSLFNFNLLKFSCVNCWKLICCNNLASSMPREFLKATCYRKRIFMDEFSMVFPGSEIPEWFKHKSEASSIKIEKPPGSDDYKMVGCVACCVFGGYKVVACVGSRVFNFHERESQDEDGDMERDYFFYENVTDEIRRPTVLQCDNYRAELDHLGLIYFPEAVFHDFDVISFSKSEVKGCGIHPVYKLTTSSTIGLDEEVDVDCDGSEDEATSELITSPNFINGESSSRSRVNEKEIEEYSNNEDEPPSKRLKEL